VEERKEVAAVQDFHHDIDGVLILKNVIKFDNVGVLADFEHFYLSLK